MFETPKDLPVLTPPKPIPGISSPAQFIQDSGNLTIKNENPTAENKKTYHLPAIEVPKSQEIVISPPKTKTDLPVITFHEEAVSFDEAIKNIHHDIIQTSTEEAPPKPAEEQEYYVPKDPGEGYFSEIKQYMASKDVQAITEDMLSKDLLTGMKDYHDQKSQGKPYYLHSHDLQHKLERKMHSLMKQEQEWHDLKRILDEKDRKRKVLEKEIDDEAQDLKELFSLIKISQVLQKEAKKGQEFGLVTGQKLASLNDLRKALSYMKEEEYDQHANSSKNDFAAWTEHAIGMPELAEKIRKTKSRHELELLLKRPI